MQVIGGKYAGLRKTLKGEGPPFRRWSLLPPNLPHPPRTSPISPPLRKRKFVSFFEGGGDIGEVFVGLGGGNYLKGAASRLFGERNT